jgi:hypothetical protein
VADGYARYDYAWKTPGWSVQNPVVPPAAYDGYVEPGLPEGLQLVRLFYEAPLELTSGRAVEGVLRIRSKQILVHTPTGKQILPRVITKRFRAGYGIELFLPATDDPDLFPNGWTYEGSLRVLGTTQEFAFELPGIPTEANLALLVDTSPVVGTEGDIVGGGGA